MAGGTGKEGSSSENSFKGRGGDMTPSPTVTKELRVDMESAGLQQDRGTHQLPLDFTTERQVQLESRQGSSNSALPRRSSLQTLRSSAVSAGAEPPRRFSNSEFPRRSPRKFSVTAAQSAQWQGSDVGTEVGDVAQGTRAAEGDVVEEALRATVEDVGRRAWGKRTPTLGRRVGAASELTSSPPPAPIGAGLGPERGSAFADVEAEQSTPTAQAHPGEEVAPGLDNGAHLRCEGLYEVLHGTDVAKHAATATTPTGFERGPQVASRGVQADLQAQCVALEAQVRRLELRVGQHEGRTADALERTVELQRRMAHAQEEAAQAQRVSAWAQTALALASMPDPTEAKIANDPMAEHPEWIINRFLLSRCGRDHGRIAVEYYTSPMYQDVLRLELLSTLVLYSGLGLEFEMHVGHFQAAVRGKVGDLRIGSFRTRTRKELVMAPPRLASEPLKVEPDVPDPTEALDVRDCGANIAHFLTVFFSEHLGEEFAKLNEAAFRLAKKDMCFAAAVDYVQVLQEALRQIDANVLRSKAAVVTQANAVGRSIPPWGGAETLSAYREIGLGSQGMVPPTARLDPNDAAGVLERHRTWTAVELEVATVAVAQRERRARATRGEADLQPHVGEGEDGNEALEEKELASGGTMEMPGADEEMGERMEGQGGVATVPSSPPSHLHPVDPGGAQQQHPVRSSTELATAEAKTALAQEQLAREWAASTGTAMRARVQGAERFYPLTGATLRPGEDAAARRCAPVDAYGRKVCQRHLSHAGCTSGSPAHTCRFGVHCAPVGGVLRPETELALVKFGGARERDGKETKPVRSEEVAAALARWRTEVTRVEEKRLSSLQNSLFDKEECPLESKGEPPVPRPGIATVNGERQTGLCRSAGPAARAGGAQTATEERVEMIRTAKRANHQPKDDLQQRVGRGTSGGPEALPRAESSAPLRPCGQRLHEGVSGRSDHLKCRDCSGEFLFPHESGRARHFARKGYANPIRCFGCIQSHKRKRKESKQLRSTGGGTAGPLPSSKRGGTSTAQAPSKCGQASAGCETSGDTGAAVVAAGEGAETSDKGFKRGEHLKYQACSPHRAREVSAGEKEAEVLQEAEGGAPIAEETCARVKEAELPLVAEEKAAAADAAVARDEEEAKLSDGAEEEAPADEEAVGEEEETELSDSVEEEALAADEEEVAREEEEAELRDGAEDEASADAAVAREEEEAELRDGAEVEVPADEEDVGSEDEEVSDAAEEDASADEEDVGSEEEEAELSDGAEEGAAATEEAVAHGNEAAYTHVARERAPANEAARVIEVGLTQAVAGGAPLEEAATHAKQGELSQIADTEGGASVADATVECEREDELARAEELFEGLKAKQRARLPAAIAELQRFGRKRGHWAWYAFPTDRSGRNEPAPASCVPSREHAARLLASHPPCWQEVIRILQARVSESGIEEVIPVQDHSRVRAFVAYWTPMPGLPSWLEEALWTFRKALKSCGGPRDERGARAGRKTGLAPSLVCGEPLATERSK